MLLRKRDRRNPPKPAGSAIPLFSCKRRIPRQASECSEESRELSLFLTVRLHQLCPHSSLRIKISTAYSSTAARFPSVRNSSSGAQSTYRMRGCPPDLEP